MNELVTLATTIGVPALVVIMLLREIRPLIKNNRKPNGVTREDLHEEHKRMILEHKERDTLFFQKIDEQTKILASIDKTQALMCQKLDNIGDGNARHR